MCRYHPTRVYTRIDGEMRSITDESTELLPPAFDELFFYHDADFFFIMPHIRSLTPSADIHMIADDGVSYVWEVWDMRVVTHMTIFILDKCSYLRVFSDTRVSSYIGIGPDDAIFTDISISVYIAPWFYDDSFTEKYISFYRYIFLDSRSHIYRLCVSTDDRVVHTEYVPWVSDGDPSS